MTVALDLETRLFEAGRLDPDPVCATWCGDDLVPHILHANDPTAEGVLRRLLTTEHLTTANGSYDLAVIMRRWPDLTEAIFDALFASRITDVQLQARLIDLAQGQLDGSTTTSGVYVKRAYSLAALSDRYGFGVLQKADTWRLRYGELMDVPLSAWPEEARSYALLDAKVTRQVYGAQTAWGEWLLDSPAQMRAAFALQLMSCRGIHTDERACRAFLAETRDEIEKAKLLLLENEIIRPADSKKPFSKDTKKAKARMEALCAASGTEPRRTAKDGICLDAEACRDSGDPVLRAYSLFTSANTTLAKTELLMQGSGAVPLQTHYVVLNNNGRTSSREPSPPLIGAQLQNLPRGSKMREVFKPRDGFYFCSLDLDMAEICTFAQVEIWTCGSSLLGEAINAKKDVHCILGAALLGCSYEEMLVNKGTGKYKKARQNAKNANFGLLGGMGIPRFVSMINKAAKEPEDRIDTAGAARIKRVWLDTWKTQQYFDWVSTQLSDQGNGVGAMYAFISKRLRVHMDFATFSNNAFSSLAADGGKAGLLPVAHEMYAVKTSPLYGSRNLLYLHDESFSELRKDRAHDAAFRKRDIILREFRKYTPDINVTASPALMEKAWYKSAEPRFKDGQLIPWDAP